MKLNWISSKPASGRSASHAEEPTSLAIFELGENQKRQTTENKGGIRSKAPRPHQFVVLEGTHALCANVSPFS
eukprot:643100-Pelagomonas_calceolata.AAC.1